MELNVEISQETFEILKKHARKAGVSVESVVGEKLMQILAGNSERSNMVNPRWNKDGKPWNQLSAEEIAACYRNAYADKPRHRIS